MAGIKKQDISPRKNALASALLTLKESIEIFAQQPEGSHFHRSTRDSLIQRFEFSIESLRKYLRHYLEFTNGIAVSSSMMVLRECVNTKLITIEEEKKIEDMISDRNETSHTYDENIAKDLATRIPDHYKLMKALFDRLTID